MGPKVSIVIVNWNGREFLKNCLSSVFAQVYPDYRVVMVDNGSTDGSAVFVRDNFPRVDLLELAENTGYPHGNNVGIKYALDKYDPDYVLLLNNDTRIPRADGLAALVAAAESAGSIGIVGCRLVYPDGQVQDMGAEITPYGYQKLVKLNGWTAPAKPYQVDAVMGAVFLIKKVVIGKIGLLDEGFAPFYFEDTDYCARARKAGYGVTVVPGTDVIHYTEQTTKRLPSDFVRGVIKRGEIRYALLNYPLSWLAKFAALEAGNFMANVLERKDKTRRISPVNIKARDGWRRNAGLLLRAYLYNLKNMAEIASKRLARSGKLWY